LINICFRIEINVTKNIATIGYNNIPCVLNW